MTKERSTKGPRTGNGFRRSSFLTPRGPRLLRESIFVTRPSLPPFKEYTDLLSELWTSRILTNNGPFLRAFETGLQEYLAADNIIVVSNGTLALQVAFRTLLKQRGEVITTPFTFPATTTALLWEGFTPRFVDIDRSTFNLDPDLVAANVTRDTVGIVSVHVYGNPGGAERLDAVSRHVHLPLIFDGAHAFGVRPSEGSIFRWGDATTLSFHATKGFHTFEGGAIVSRSPRLSSRIRLTRNFGIVNEELVELPGINAKMSEAQAALGLINLRYISGWIERRRLLFELYRDLLCQTPKIEFQEQRATHPNFTYMPLLFPSRRIRDRVMARLLRNGIHARKYFYPLASNLPFIKGRQRLHLPIATSVSERVLTLPLYPDLPESEVRRICGVVLRSLKSDVS